MAQASKNRQLVTVADQAKSLRELLTARKAELAAALPRHITADRLLRLMMTAVTRNPKLLACTQASLYGALLQTAQLGLEPDLLGQSYLVPFRNTKKGVVECQLIPGYLGLLTLARRSGQIASVEARVVRKGDKFSFRYGLDPKLEHEPVAAPLDKSPLTHVYALARFIHGGVPSWLVMTREEVEQHRARSRSANEGPWVTDYEAMSLKTVLRQLCKFLPSSVELQTAVALDEAHEAGIPQDLPELPPLVDDEPARAISGDGRPEAKPDAAKGSGEPAASSAGSDCGCPDAPNDVHVDGCSKKGQSKLL